MQYHDVNLEWARKAPEFELIKWIEHGQTGFKKTAAKYEYERRKSRKEFLTKNLPTWFSLAVSITSLIIVALNKH